VALFYKRYLTNTLSNFKTNRFMKRIVMALACKFLIIYFVYKLNIVILFFNIILSKHSFYEFTQIIRITL
jgi:hypothetical protein